MIAFWDLAPMMLRRSVCRSPADNRFSLFKFEGKHKNEAISQHLRALKKEVKQLQAEATKPPPLRVVEAAVHMKNFIT